MGLKRVIVFMGTRPEAIKLAPVVAAMRAQPDLDCTVVATGQHREMFAQVAQGLRFNVDINLDVMTANQSLAELTGRLLSGIDRTIIATAPSFALVQGDTTTVLAAALACFYRRVPIGHVEAGLRTGNIWSPFPEEANRRLAAPLVYLHFAPTQGARRALLAEGVRDDSIEVTGNTVIDALRMELAAQRDDPQATNAVEQLLQTLIGGDWKDVPFVLITGHRRENWGTGIEQICRAIVTLSARFPGYRFVYPVHLNPNVSESVRRLLGGRSNVFLLPPLDYGAFITLLSRSTLVLTDSGGVQEEAPSLGKPVLVMRDTTERPEGVEAGTAILAGPSESSIVSHVERLLCDRGAYAAMVTAKNPYGDGRAAEKIVARLRRALSGSGPISSLVL